MIGRIVLRVMLPGVGRAPVRGPSARFVLDASLTELAFRCYPDGCPRGRTCCVGLAVEVARREVRAIDTLMDELARLVPALREGRGFELIESRDDGSCPFLFRTRRRALCSIHHVALRTGRPVEDFKPAACRHWPIVLEADGECVRVTVEPAASRMGCVAPIAHLPGQPTVLAAFRGEIAALCGEDVVGRRPRAGSQRARLRGRENPRQRHEREQPGPEARCAQHGGSDR